MLRPPEHTRIIFILLFGAICISLSRGCSHWRIHTDRQHGDRLLILQLSNKVDNLLCATDGECWNKYRAIPLRRIINEALQRVFWILWIVKPVP